MRDHDLNDSDAKRPGPDAGASSRAKLRDTMKTFLPFLEKPTSDASEGEGVRINVDQQWIDLGLIRGWLEACNRQHGHVCQLVKHNPNSPTCSPAWLIDVKDLCVVRGTPEMQYSALSYV